VESSSGEVDGDEQSTQRCHLWALKKMLEPAEDPLLCSGCPNSQSAGAAAITIIQRYQLSHNQCLVYIITHTVHALTTAWTFDHTSAIS
jgi:hypothetical protein